MTTSICTAPQSEILEVDQTQISYSATPDFFTKYGAAIAQRMSPSNSGGDMKVNVVGAGSLSQSFDVQFGNCRKILKRFDTTQNDGLSFYFKERDALRTFSKSGLVPKLDFFSDEGGFVAMQWIDGADLRDVLTQEELDSICQSVGKWLGNFAKTSPYEESTETWQNYLHNYEQLRDCPIVRENRAFLEGFETDRFVLAKNDGALTNLRYSMDGQLFGIDLEQSQFKPFGWDLLLTARALIRLYPQEIETITSNLAYGFCRATYRDTKKYKTFLRIVGVGAAVEVSANSTETPVQTALQNYNASSDTPAQIVAAAPFVPARMQKQDSATIEAFATHLESLSVDLSAPGSEEASASQNEQPPAALKALCAACQGNCCKRGAENNAYITEEKLGRLARQDDGFNKRELVELYLAHLPENHVMDSCFYHGASGCTLPRNMRSDVCNGYECRSGKTLLRQIRELPVENVLCVAGKGANFRKAVVTSGERSSEVPISKLTQSNRPIES